VTVRRTATAAKSAGHARRAGSASQRAHARSARRVSGPAPRPAPRHRRGVARLLQAPVARALRSRGAGVLDALLHGRGWIGLVGVLLVGIVFLNVARLELSRGIAQTDEHSAALERSNARLRLLDARLGSSERIQQLAERRGMVLPAPGDVHYLRLRPQLDGRLAARRATSPWGAIQTASVPSASPPVPAAPTTTPTPAPAPAPAAGPAAPAATTPAQQPATPTAPPALATAPSGQG
jgi:hypothetical protein